MWDDKAAAEFERPDLGPEDLVRWVTQYPWSAGYMRSVLWSMKPDEVVALTVEDYLRSSIDRWLHDREPNSQPLA